MKSPGNPKCLFLVVAAALAASTSYAQFGTGWSQYTPATSLQQEGNVFYNNSGGVETFRLNDVDAKRCEIQLTARWSSGLRQFQGDVRCTGTPRDAGNSVQQVMQDGSPDQDVNQLRFYASSGGTLKVLQGQTLGTGIYGVWERINTIHDAGSDTVYTFLNGSLKSTVSVPNSSTFYFKYGIYIAGTSGKPQTEWKSIKTWSKSGGGIFDTASVYHLQNEASSLVLNNQGSLNNGTAITQWSSSSTSQNLQWKLIPTSNGYYQINSVKSGKDAAVEGSSTSTGAGIVQWSFGSSGNDQWKPVQNSDGSYTFFNLHSGLVLEDPGSSTSTSTQMDQWTSNGGSNQKWKLVKQ